MTDKARVFTAHAQWLLASDSWEKLRTFLAPPTFPRRNDATVTLQDGSSLQFVSREYADALEWEAGREAF